MEKRDKILFKIDGEVIKEFIYVSETQTQYLLSMEEKIVEEASEAVLGDNDLKVSSFWPIKKKHNFVKINDNIWELDCTHIEADDL